MTPNPQFYQVKAAYVFIPEEMPVYMTLKQIQARSSIVPDSPQSLDGWYLVTQHAPLVFDQGDVLGLAQTPDPLLAAKLQPGKSPAQASFKPESSNHALCPFTELAQQPDAIFKTCTGMARAEFTHRLNQLASSHRPLRGRKRRFELQDGLYLWCLRQRGQYTYAQLAQCYGWSITQIYSTVQWIKQHLLFTETASFHLNR